MSAELCLPRLGASWVQSKSWDPQQSPGMVDTLWQAPELS